MLEKIAWGVSKVAFAAAQDQRRPHWLRGVLQGWGTLWFWLALFCEGRALSAICEGRPKRARLERLKEPLARLARHGLGRIGWPWLKRTPEVVPLVQAWWNLKMASTRRPLEEKMTLFWHDHFATSAQKVVGSMLMYGQNEILRANATKDFRTLLTNVSCCRSRPLVLSLPAITCSMRVPITRAYSIDCWTPARNSPSRPGRLAMPRSPPA